MPFVTLDSNIEIFYETYGEGSPLLLVSGTGHDHTFWSAQLPLLSTDYRCIVFDNRGGRQEHGARSWIFPGGHGG